MKNLTQKWNGLFLLCFFSLPLFGQKSISGHVTDANKQVLPYLPVLVLNATDSAYVNGTVTDGDGKFTIAEKNPGNYLLSIKSMGSVPYYRNVVLVNEDIDVGDLMLSADPTQLKEVNVVATKKLIEFDGDKLVMDLTASPVTAGLNALEMLSKVPGVTVNMQSQTVQIAGKTGIMVMIDGRPTNLSGVELANMLKSMKSDEFEKVEVITNPSAKYEAEGTTGIINLKTKSGKVYGSNYMLNLGVGYSHYEKYGNYPKYNEGFSVNLRRKKVTAFLNLNHNRGTDFLWTDESRAFLDSKNTVYQRHLYTEMDKGENNYYSSRLNLDFYLFKKTTFGFSISASFFDGNKESIQKQEINSGSDVSLFNVNADKRTSDDMFYSFANAHVKHTFDTSGTELSIDLDMIRNRMNTRNKFYENRISGGASKESFYHISNLVEPVRYILRASFEKQLHEKMQLEVGYRSNFAQLRTTFASNFVPIDSLSRSTFDFLENINAAYALLRTTLSRDMKMELGLRGEHTYTLGKNEGRKVSGQNYINLFPSFSINKRINSWAFSMGYSRRIGRPPSTSFNTMKRFHAPLRYTQGNTSLIASLNDSYNASATFKDKYFAELAYIYRKNEFYEVLEADTTLLPGYSLFGSAIRNVKGKVSWWTLRGYFPFSVGKLWTINVQWYAGLNDYHYTLIENRVKLYQIFWGGSCQHTFSITETWGAEINAWINSGETSGFQTSRSMAAIDFGISKKILKGNATIKLSVQDPFNLYNYKARLDYDDISGTGRYNWDNRSLYLNFTYNFGNRDVQVNQWQSKFKSADLNEKK